MTSAYPNILERIAAALEAARKVFHHFTPGEVETEFKAGHDPVTAADREVDAALRQNLLRKAKAGFPRRRSTISHDSKESASGWSILSDGTREFVKGLPEFCVSIGFVENGRAVAGGDLQPRTGERFWDRSTPACSTTASLPSPAAAPALPERWCWPAAAK